MPPSRIELDPVWSTQRRRTAIIVQPDSVGSAGGTKGSAGDTIAVSQRLTVDELLERDAVERFAPRRSDRGPQKGGDPTFTNSPMNGNVAPTTAVRPTTASRLSRRFAVIRPGVRNRRLATPNFLQWAIMFKPRAADLTPQSGK